MGRGSKLAPAGVPCFRRVRKGEAGGSKPVPGLFIEIYRIRHGEERRLINRIDLSPPSYSITIPQASKSPCVNKNANCFDHRR